MFYTTVGPVRGECGHKHRFLHTAKQCLDRDMDGCVFQGGYSDRRIVVVDNGVQRELTDEEEKWTH